MLAGLPTTLLSLISSCNKNKEGSLQQAITGCSAKKLQAQPAWSSSEEFLPRFWSCTYDTGTWDQLSPRPFPSIIVLTTIASVGLSLGFSNSPLYFIAPVSCRDSTFQAWYKDNYILNFVRPDPPPSSSPSILSLLYSFLMNLLPLEIAL